MRITRLALTCVTALSVAGISVAAYAAPLYEGNYYGTTDDEGETVSITTHRNDNGRLLVTRFKVVQGECGTTSYTHRNAPDVMPVRVRRDAQGRRFFRIVDDVTIPSAVVFRVRGTWQTSDVIAGQFSQIACDGESDTWVAYGADS